MCVYVRVCVRASVRVCMRACMCVHGRHHCEVAVWYGHMERGGAVVVLRLEEARAASLYRQRPHALCRRVCVCVHGNKTHAGGPNDTTRHVALAKPLDTLQIKVVRHMHTHTHTHTHTRIYDPTRHVALAKPL